VPGSKGGHVASSGASDAGSVRPVVSCSASDGLDFCLVNQPTALFV